MIRLTSGVSSPSSAFVAQEQQPFEGTTLEAEMGPSPDTKCLGAMGAMVLYFLAFQPCGINF
jgi:hypothetical protein